MNHKENFNNLMTSIFEEDWKPITVDDFTNNFIGALANSEYKFFTDGFINMISALRKTFNGNKVEIANLVKTIRNVASERGCVGAYAELCVLHALNIGEYFTVSTDNTLNATESFASNMGHTCGTNMDGYIPEYDIYFDTKSFRDTITSILKNVKKASFQELEKDGFLNKGQNNKVSVSFQFKLTDSENRYEDKFKELKDEFVSKFKNKMLSNNRECKKIKSIKSDIIPELKYIFNWGGITSSEGSYSPYQRAENLVRPILVRYTDKFLLNHPVMLVFVNHPWFNRVDTDAFDFNGLLYRALSRRIFMQFRNSEMKMHDLDGDFKGDETIDEVSTHISALLFIDVFSAEDRGQPYKCYFYTNPRAKNPLRAEPIKYSLSSKKILEVIDDFMYDNY